MTRRARVIPCLLLKDGGLVKTRKFRDPVYVGDPVNAVRIFNEKEADEIVILDIDASVRGAAPDFALIAEIAGEAFMPVTYGGGVRSLSDVKQLIRSGVEKVAINNAATQNIDLISEAAAMFGRQAIVGVIDIKKTILSGYKATTRSGSAEIGKNFLDHIKDLQRAGVGEIFVNHIDRDGTMQGYDLELFKRIVSVVDVPVVACGGAGSLEHFVEVIAEAGVDAVAAGSLFVFHGKHRAVLITYPTDFVLNLGANRGS
jgi:cyclase